MNRSDKLSIASGLDLFYKNVGGNTTKQKDAHQEFKQSTLGQISNGEILGGKYRINFSSPLAEKNSHFASAYCVEDATGNDADLYALVLKPDYPARMLEIISARNHKDLPCLTPIDCVFIKPPQEQQYQLTLIFLKVKWPTLRSYLNSQHNKKINRQSIFGSILEATDAMHKAGIIHGSINPDTIYIDDNLNIILDECFSELPGFKQLPAYKAPGNLQCHPYGCDYSSTTEDYYALGILLFFIVVKKDFHEKSSDFIIKGIISTGTYAFLSDNFSIPGEYAELIRGLTYNNPNKRWKYEETIRFLEDGSIKTAPEAITYFETGVIFNDVEINSLEELAVLMSRNWEYTKDFLKRDDLVKWLNHGGKQQKLAENLQELRNRVRAKTNMSKVFSSEDELVIKSLMLMDPHGPIRLRDITFFKEAAGNILLYGLNNNTVELTQSIANCAFGDLFAFYDDSMMKESMQGDHKNHQSLDILKNASNNFRKNGFYFGIERLLYDLNPHLPAVHTRLKSAWCMSLEDLLMEMEIAKEADREEMLNNKSLLSFISSKLQLDNEYKNKANRENSIVLPVICRKEIQTANAYALAQKQAGIQKLPVIAATLHKLLQIVAEETLHGKDHKTAVLEDLEDALSKGDLFTLFMAFAENEHLSRDADGYASALRKAHKLAESIIELRGRQAIELRATADGKKIAVYASYFVACFALISVMLRIM